MRIKMTDKNTEAPEQTLEQAKFEAKKAMRAEKAVNRQIQAQWTKCTKWKTTVKPDSTDKLSKYSIAKLNGLGKCKDIISFCVEKHGRLKFEKMMNESVTSESFCKLYGFNLNP